MELTLATPFPATPLYLQGGFEPSPMGPRASNHMWMFAPGNNWDSGNLASGNKNFAATMFTQIPTQGFFPTGTPPDYAPGGSPALIEASASVYGDHLFVFVRVSGGSGRVVGWGAWAACCWAQGVGESSRGGCGVWRA